MKQAAATKSTPTAKSGNLSSLSVPFLAAVLSVCGCEGEKSVKIGPPKTDGAPQSLVTATYTRTSNVLAADTIRDLTLKFPKGDFRVSIIEFKLSDTDGLDSLKGAKQLWARDFHSPEDGFVEKVEIGTVEIERSIVIISGQNAQKQNVQQVIVPKADEPLLIPKVQ